MDEQAAANRPIAVLDDDPTGVQTLAGVSVVIDWTPDRIASALGRQPVVHVLTNSRAYPEREAEALVDSAACAVAQADAEAIPVLRGDSTLRGHVLGEYLALARHGGSASPPLLLAPALPSAGRVTIAGVQYVEREGDRVPVHLTEYARDGVFAYGSSRLLEWAEERTTGLFRAADGIEVRLPAIRSEGTAAVVRAVTDAAAAPVPTAVAFDSETEEDVALLAAGFRRALAVYPDAVLRCGPAVAGALGDATATVSAEFPPAVEILLVCGSYVSQSGTQLAAVARRQPGSVLEVGAELLARHDEGELGKVEAAVAARLDTYGLAVLATPRERPSSLTGLQSGLDVARGLAALVRVLDRPSAVLILKGGVTSAVVLREGLGAVEARVVGPVLPGVALWELADDRARRRLALVVPGNVGDDQLLVTIIDALRHAGPG